MGFLERKVTVNFNNQTSRTLYMTSESIENDGAYSHTNPPGAIQPQEKVSWSNAESDLVSTIGSVDYKFSRIDNGQDGHVHVGWNDPVNGGNTYNISCDPSPLYGIMYTGGKGTSPTINVTLVERDLSAKYGQLYCVNRTCFLAANLDAATVEMVGLNQLSGNLHSPADQRSWALYDPATGQPLQPPFTKGQAVKIRSGKAQAWLTAYSNENNRIAFYPPGYADYPDQHWEITYASDDYSQAIMLRNVNCGLYLTAAAQGQTPYVTADGNDRLNQYWQVR